MKPLMQTRTTNETETEHGNCFAACVASILELPIDDVPRFEEMPDGQWFLPFWDLLKAYGYEFHGTRTCGDLPAWPEDTTLFEPLGPGVDGYYIVGGGSPRGVKRGHCVIYKDGRMVHDPHPSQAGVTCIQEVYLIERAS